MLDSKESYLIPKGHAVFKSGLCDVYVHGGLTPEELIVPFYTVSFKKQKIEKPKIELVNGDKKFYFKRKYEIKLKIINITSYLLEEPHIRIDSPDSDPYEFDLNNIEAYDTIEFKIPEIKFYETGDNYSKLILSFSCNVNGEEKTFNYDLKATFGKLEKDNILKGLF